MSNSKHVFWRQCISSNAIYSEVIETISTQPRAVYVEGDEVFILKPQPPKPITITHSSNWTDKSNDPLFYTDGSKFVSLNDNVDRSISRRK
jgi:hypothetical protein